MLRFLDLSPDEANTKEIVAQDWRIHEKVSPIRNMNQRSLAVLNDQECKIVESVAGRLLEHLGYMS